MSNFDTEDKMWITMWKLWFSPLFADFVLCGYVKNQTKIFISDENKIKKNGLVFKK